MSARATVYLLLAVVATAAAVLSFAALRDLAVLCGFSTRLAWLLPVTVDAGAAAGSIVWLGGQDAAPARRFARTLALVLLASSVIANALGHGLAAYGARPHWLVVVAVSAVAPAVLGAVVHLAVLMGRSASVPEPVRRDGTERAVVDDDTGRRVLAAVPDSDLDLTAERITERVTERVALARQAGEPVPGRRRLAAELGVTEHAVRTALATADVDGGEQR